MAGLPVLQTAFEKSLQVIISPPTGVNVYVVLLPPKGIEKFLNHWKTGFVPPLAGTAVHVTELPAQQGLGEAVIVIETGAEGMTLMVIPFDVAGFPVAQVRLEVNTQVIISPFVGEN